MSSSPTIRQHAINTRIVGMQPHEKFSQIGPGLDPMSLRSSENGEQDRGARSRLRAAKKEPILAANGLVT